MSQNSKKETLGTIHRVSVSCQGMFPAMNTSRILDCILKPMQVILDNLLQNIVD